MKIKKELYIVVAVITLVLSIGAVSYAAWNNIFVQKGENVIQTGTFSVKYAATNNINLDNAYPIVDAAGEATEGYTFTVQNTGTTMASFDVSINRVASSTLADDQLRLAVDGDKEVAPTTVSDLPQTDVVVSEGDTNSYSNARYILTDTLAPASKENGKDGEKKTYTIKLWLKEDASISPSQKSEYDSKIVVNAVATMPTSSQS